MSNTERFLAYLNAYARKDLAVIEGMFCAGIQLRDWKLSVSGRDAAIAETRKNFSAAKTLEIDVLAMHQSGDAVAGELRILVDGHIELHVVDVVAFAEDGRIKVIRAYLGRGDGEAAP
jgi:hypothetical protein